MNTEARVVYTAHRLGAACICSCMKTGTNSWCNTEIQKFYSQVRLLPGRAGGSNPECELERISDHRRAKCTTRSISAISGCDILPSKLTVLSSKLLEARWKFGASLQARLWWLDDQVRASQRPQLFPVCRVQRSVLIKKKVVQKRNSREPALAS